MECPKDKELLKFVLKEIDKDKGDKISLHLISCPECLSKTKSLIDHTRECPNKKVIFDLAENKIKEEKKVTSLEEHFRRCNICKKIYENTQKSLKIVAVTDTRYPIN